MKIFINTKILVILLLLNITTFHGLLGQNFVIDKHSEWKYYDLGVFPGEGWKNPNYEDSFWQSDSAQFGYGNGNENTVVSFGTDVFNKIPTTYFRKEFKIDAPEKYERLALSFIADDGIVVYLNGNEILRYNMSYKDIKFYSYALQTIEFENKFKQFFIDTKNLLKKKNILAVEIHQESPSSDDVSFDLMLEYLDPIVYERNIRKAPYLTFSGNNSEVQLNWQLNVKQHSKIVWGDDVKCSDGSIKTQEYTKDHLHKFVFNKLKNSTKYYYKVIVNRDTLEGSFIAAPKSDENSIKFFVYGDTRSFPENHNRVAKQIISTYKKDPTFQTLVISVGDIVSEGDMETAWDYELFDPNYPNLQEMLANMPFLAVMGNHERTGQLYKKYLPYPTEESKRHYWSFDYGPVHIVMLDQYTKYNEGSTQLEWLKKDLKASKKEWKFIVLHEPGWTAGGHHGYQADVQKYIQPLCVKYGVQVVFGGHQHFYARAVVDGIQHITTGGGGAWVGKPNLAAPFVVAGAQEYHFCKIEIDGPNLSYTVITDKGEKIDSFQTKNNDK